MTNVIKFAAKIEKKLQEAEESHNEIHRTANKEIKDWEASTAVYRQQTPYTSH